MSLWIIPACFALSCGITLWVLRRAKSLQLLDLPNDRSSHTLPTPRGGGLAIAVTVLALLSMAAVSLGSGAPVLLSIVAGGVVIAVVGLVDDRWGLSARLRFLLQFVVALSVVLVLGGAPDEVLAVLPWAAGVAGTGLCVLVVLWFLNLFNFMDGIDGIAACQSIFMCAAAALLGSVYGSGADSVVILCGIGAASAGFLVWNWAPARIFMGDVGSAFLGFLLPVLAIWMSENSPVGVWTFVVLGTLFIGDSSATLMRRTLNGEKWHEAHRSHVYQRLSRRFRSHARVTLGFAAANLLLVLPLAWMTLAFPGKAALIAIATTVTSIAVFWSFGAGQRDAV
jgi:Fuc2NAc and GlcNAc transferase